MTNVQSKLASTVLCTCKDFQHPWTERCANASAGILLSSTPYCLRVYTVVYALSLLMRHRIPTPTDLKRTLQGIIQSTAFLVTNSYTFILYNCLLRHILGGYYLSTVAFVPCFLASWTAIVLERPARRPLLTLYVSNLATETLWRMAEARGYVRSLPHGQTLIFGISISILLYLYRLGLHKTTCKDSLFRILRMFVGSDEEGPLPKSVETENETSTHDPHTRIQSRTRSRLNVGTIAGMAQAYIRLIEILKGKHRTCAHRKPCIQYAVMGGLKPFVGGLTLQVALKLLLNAKRIVQLRMEWRKTLFNRSTLNLGLFLGSFSLLYKSVSCILRHTFDRDDARFAIPAGLIGSIAFTHYPDITVALYVMWKMLQNIYILAHEKGLAPRIPGFLFFLYSFATSVLFHSAILEPKTLRPSYYKFLQSISGSRLTRFNLEAFDAFGLNSAQNTREVITNLKIGHKTPYPLWPMVS